LSYNPLYTFKKSTAMEALKRPYFHNVAFLEISHYLDPAGLRLSGAPGRFGTLKVIAIG
jgi:hypothetical protein